MGNYIPFRLPFQEQDNADIEVIGSNLAMNYRYTPKSGSYFANHFVMAGEKFENINPETFLCGEQNDLYYLTNKPIPFPYTNAPPDAPSNTIRSLVHLRRGTLKLHRIDDDGTDNSDVYRVEFIFDSDVACAVRIYLMATEDLSTNTARYKTRKPDYCSDPIEFDKGAGQIFKSEFLIKPDEFQPSELNYIPRAIEIPLVIQITVEDPAFQGQSESTFAGIEKLSEGAYAIKFMKQKVMVDGLCFMTQEIYGIENKTAAEKAVDDEPGSDNTECIICMTSIRDTLMLPCRHLCLCNICAEEMRTKQNRCPICRGNFHALLQIKGVRSRKKSNEQGPDDPQEELEEISIIEALNGDLQTSEELDAESVSKVVTLDLKPRRSSSGRSRRMRPRSAKYGRPEIRSYRGSTRSLKTDVSVKQEPAPPGPVEPSAPPVSPDFIETLHQEQIEGTHSDNDEGGDGEDTARSNSSRCKVLSSIVSDSIEINDEKTCPQIDPSLPGTPMGSDTSATDQMALTESLSSSSGKSIFSTRAQITTPSNIRMDECKRTSSPDPMPDEQS